MKVRLFRAGTFLAAFAVLLPLSGARATVSAAGGGLIAYADGAGIVVAKSDGTSPVHVTSVAGDSNPSWNGEGTKIVFNRGATLEIVTVPNPPAAGTVTAIPTATGTDPAFSPDGTKVAYVDAGEVKVTTIDGATITNLTNSGADDKDPAWNPDGTRIAFARAPGATYSIWTMSADGTGQTQITSSGASDVRPTYSPSGATIAFESDRDGVTQHQVYSVSAGGGSQTRLTNTANNETQPSYTPDGTRILFSETVGSPGVYSIPAGGGASSPVVAGANLAPEQQPLVLAGTPFISGSTNQGSTLTASPGTWRPTYNLTFTYQWQHCDSSNFCVNVGTNSSTYTLTGADVGQQMQVIVTGTNGWGSQTVTSARTAAVTGGPGPVNTVLPTITLPATYDAPQIGLFLSATTGTWTGQAPITFTYQWTKCDDKTKNCYDIAGATSSIYTPTADVANWDISVTITAKNPSDSTYARAVPTKPVTGAIPTNHGSPVITGQNYVKQQLTATTGIWQGLTPLSYAFQWKRCDALGNLDSCVAIPGATTSTYILQTADLDKTIRVFVTATNALTSVTQQSNHTFPTLPERHFKPSNTASPAITGTTRPGFLLRTTVGSWSGDFPQTNVYQWERCDATGAKCVAIKRATKNRYTLTTADLGSTIRVKVTATNAYGTDSDESDAVGPITVSKKSPKGRRIIGTPKSDYLPGSGGNDVIIGGAGNDTLLGGAGNDVLDGGPGNDVIDGGPGKDRINGGPGSDTILAADGEKDVIDCGPGNDRVVADAIDVLKNCEAVTIAGTSAPAPSSP